MTAATARAERVTAGVSFAASLTFDGISHRFGRGDPVLRDVSLVAEPGEVLCLLGPSGSGKTTLLRIASGIERQTAGTLSLNGSEIAGPNIFLPPEERSIGLVFQDFALFPHMTILDNVRFGLTALSREEAKKEAMIALARVGLEDEAQNYPHVLSGGQQQRVALARALAPRPAVLLMDEPFSGLDSRLRDNVRAETMAILHESRATSLIVTHDAEEAMRLGDRIALLRTGRVVQIGTAEEFYHKPVNLFAAGFFSELNVLHARVAGGCVDTPLGRFVAPGMADGSRATIAIRYSGIEVDSEGAVPAHLISRRFLGVVELVEFAIPGMEERLWGRVRCGVLSSDAQDVRVNIHLPDVLVFETEQENE
jgi:iron(III) transport system ATP-binding protein